MRIISRTVPGASHLTRVQVELSKKARQRLKWFDYYNSRSHNARLTCRHFDISPQTFYRWDKGKLVVLKHFTARDIISRWDVVDVYCRATASTAAHFLDKLEQRMPFTVRAIQVDGGSEFEVVFEEECQKRNIKLFVLPPRSSKLNGYVERAHRIHTEEFYEVTESSFDIAELRGELLDWEQVYNAIRPHQALGYLTPLKLFTTVEASQKRGGNVSLMYRTSRL